MALWSSERKWGGFRLGVVLPQFLTAAAVVAIGAYLVHNTLVNMARQGIATGFGYLGHEASFAVGETLIAYSPSDTYARALLVGVLNTLVVSAVGVVAATLLGSFIGIARLSRNWLVSRLAWAYVEGLRNVPLLLQLIIWWDVLRVAAPAPRQAWQPLPNVFLSNRGLAFPTPVWSLTYLWAGAVLIAVLLLGGMARRWSRDGTERWGVGATAALAVVAAAFVLLATGGPLTLDRPALHGFNFSGGHTVSPEFAALLFGLTVYTAAFIAEIVRGGIVGVSRGQGEAAAALGLSRWRALRLIILPQALRLIIPPLISEYLALIKNSSLAVAIGFPDLTSITYTTLNQTGQAVEAIALMMAIYLAISLATSLVANLYNARIVAVER